MVRAGSLTGEKKEWSGFELVTERRRQRGCPKGREEMNAYTQPAN